MPRQSDQFKRWRYMNQVQSGHVDWPFCNYCPCYIYCILFCQSFIVRFVFFYQSSILWVGADENVQSDSEGNQCGWFSSKNNEKRSTYHQEIMQVLSSTHPSDNMVLSWHYCNELYQGFFCKINFQVRQIPDDLFFRYLPNKPAIFYPKFSIFKPNIWPFLVIHHKTISL